MKTVRIFSNCQGQCLEVFLKRALPHWDIKCFPHLATFYKEFTPEFLAEEHWKADIVLFHHAHDDPQDYPTRQPKIPLSVWFQSAPFMAQVPGEIWQQLRESNADPEWIVKEADLDYESRWEECWEKMKWKEENEHVPEAIRVSDLMELGRGMQLQLTCNHPTSIVFWHWTNRILKYLDITPGPNAITGAEALNNLNLGGLPCEESATTGARKHLGLSWGGRPEDDESGREICRKMLA